MDRGPNALIRPAPANVTRHPVIDILVRRMRRRREQIKRLHDLPGLAVSALRDVYLGPRLLHRMRTMGRNTFNRRDVRAFQLAHRLLTRPHRCPVVQHRPCPAQSHPTSKFCPGQSENVAQIPQQRHLWIAIKSPCCAIYLEMNHKASPFDSRANGNWRLFYAEAVESCTTLPDAGGAQLLKVQ